VMVVVVLVLLQFRKMLKQFVELALADDFQIVLNAGDDAELGVVGFVWFDRCQQGDAHLVDHLSGFVRLWVHKRDRLVFNVDRLALVDILEAFRIRVFRWDDVAIGLGADCPDLNLYFLDVAVDADLVQQAWKTPVLSGEVEGDDWLVVGVDGQTLRGAAWTKVGWGSLAFWQNMNSVVWQFGWVIHYVDATDVWLVMVLWFIVMRGVWLMMVLWMIGVFLGHRFPSMVPQSFQGA